MQIYIVLPLLFLILRNRSVKFLTVVRAFFVAMAFMQTELGVRFMIFKSKYGSCSIGCRD